MKRLVSILIIAGMLLCLQGCSNEDEKKENETSAAEASDMSDTSAEEEIYRTLPLLENSFGKLDEQNEYYIETSMTVESVRSPDRIFRYVQTVAIDKTKKTGMSRMTSVDEDGSETTISHIIIKNKTAYTINDSEMTYTTESYKNSPESFGKIYTTEQYLGTTEYLIPGGSGKAEITLEGAEKKVVADYESYRMSANSSDSPAADDTYITYYFHDKKPVLEIIENSEGKTTFTFRSVEYKISDRSVFDTDKYSPEAE